MYFDFKKEEIYVPNDIYGLMFKFYKRKFIKFRPHRDEFYIIKDNGLITVKKRNDNDNTINGIILPYKFNWSKIKSINNLNCKCLNNNEVQHFSIKILSDIAQSNTKFKY